MNSKYYVKILLKRKYLIAAICVISAMSTFVLLRLKNKEYISKAQIATGITDDEEVTVTQKETNWNMLNNRFNNFIEFMNSKEIYNLVMYKLLMHDLNSETPFRPVEVSKIKKNLSPAQLDNINKLLQLKYDSMQVIFLHNQDEARLSGLIKQMKYDIKSIKTMLSITRIPNTDFIRLECKSENPDLSAIIVNQFSQETIRFFGFREMKRLGNSVTFFKDLVKRKKLALDSANNMLEKFKNASHLIDYKVQSGAKLDQIASLELAKNEESKKVASLRNAIKQANMKLNVGTNENDLSSTALNNNITTLQNRITNLNKKYVYSGMKDNKILDTINLLRDNLDQQINSFSQGTYANEAGIKQDLLTKRLNYEIELSMSEASLNYINSALGQIKGEVSTLALNETSISEMEMATKVAQEEYLTMVNKYNTLNNIATANAENLTQIEFGQPAEAPEPSKQILFTLVSAFASALLSATIILLLVYFDKSIKTPADLTKVTKLNTIGYVSKVQSDEINFKSIFSNLNGSKTELLVKEQLRKLRYEIEDSGGKVFLFTSTKENEGKSFAIYSIAYSLSLNNKKVLIIDTNFKNNTLTRMCKDKGLENYLSEDKVKYLTGLATSTELAKNFTDGKAENGNKDFILHTDINGVDIIGSKGNQYSPSEVFYGRDFKKMLEELSNVYDIILMEGAALNSYSDTKELAIYADKIIAIFAANSEIKDLDKASLKFLQNNKEKFLGAVLNKVDAENMEL